jgi:pSer/pThr/pTyr-binding forkhead associated (FHA) protein
VPVTLVVKRRGEEDLPPVSFDGPRVVVGRGSSCDLRIPDASVSSRHASIRANGAQWAIVDEGSTNGTRLNGEKLATHSPRPIKSGDTILIGRIEVSVKVGAAPVSNTQQTRELALALVARSIGDQGAVAASVIVRAGPDEGSKLDLVRDAPRTIGRDPRCSLRLTDKSVPPTALEVSLDGSRVRIAVKDARAEVRVGERLVTDSAIWTDGVELHLGDTTLVLDDPLARALDQSAHGEDEKLSPESLAPPPPHVIDAPPPAAVAEPPPAPPRPKYDRRSSWRGATLAFEILAAIVALAVLAGSIAGLLWLLRK